MLRVAIIITVTASAVLVGSASVAEAQEQGGNLVVYQPDILGVDRLFVVALRVPVDAPEVEITVPEEVALLDRTPLPAKSDVRKYYFRTLKPAQKADIVFAHPAGPITVSVEIWSFEQLREFRTLKNVQLPRRWPLHEPLPELKQGQTTTTDKLKEQMAGKGTPGKAWLDFTDDQIWSIQPDTSIPRWHWVNVSEGCPVHGKQIYEGRAFYPWLDENDQPIRTYGSAHVPYAWKIKCPVSGELYPSNDFANDDFTSGEFPDDGIGGGYVAPNGVHYGFIAETCQSYCHKMLSVAPACANGYLATGDVAYVHKALVALSRLAVEWAYLGTMTHHRHRNTVAQVERIGQSRFEEGPFLGGAGFTVYCIDLPGYQMSVADAYDKIFPAIEQDAEIIPYLQAKGFTDIQTHEDLRRFIEENLFAVFMQGAMDGATSSNEPFSQMGLARMAEVLNYERGNEFMDWLYDGAGKMRYFVTNTFFRDGSPYESSGGYNGMHVTALGPIVESIEHLRELRPEVYPNEKYPDFTQSRRYEAIFDFSMNTVNIDRTYPRVGDDGAWPQYSKRGITRWQNGGTAAFEHAYKIFKSPKFAWALASTTGWQPSLEFPYTREEIEEVAKQWSPDWNDKSRVEDGYGLAMLRSGEGINKRSLWMMYGRARGHTHDDMLHIGLDAQQSEILGHMGYPRNWSAWEGNWMTQIQARQLPAINMTAQAQLLVDAGPVHLAEALAHNTTDQVAGERRYVIDDQNWQRRMLAIVDVSDEEFYCLDLYRIFGGNEHWWTFHCQEGDFTTEGLNLVKQETGTLAGPDVPYGDETWLKAQGCSKGLYGWRGYMFAFPHIYNIERDAVPTGVWHADWALKNADGLHFRLTVPAVDDAEVAIGDATSPAGGKPYEMKFVTMHNTAGEPVQTQIPGIMELYRDKPIIKSVRPLALSGDDEAGFTPYGLVIELANGRVDTIFAAADGSTARSAEGGFEFAGRFGLYSERNGVPQQMVLVGGTKLLKGGIGIEMEQAEYRGEINATDYDNRTVTVSPAPTNPGAMVGQTVYVTNPNRRVACKVLAAKAVEGGAELQLEYDPLVGVGQVSGYEDGKVLSNTPFQLRGYRYYHGAWVENAAGDKHYRLAGIAGGAVFDPELHPDVNAAQLEVEFPKQSWFKVRDYGVGDEVVWPQAVSVSRSNQHVYTMTAGADFTLSLPKGAVTE